MKDNDLPSPTPYPIILSLCLFFMAPNMYLPKTCNIIFRQPVTKPRGVAAGGRLREAEPG